MHPDLTAVTIQSNKIVSNEVKDSEALLEPSDEKKTNELFGQPLSSARFGFQCSYYPLRHFHFDTA